MELRNRITCILGTKPSIPKLRYTQYDSNTNILEFEMLNQDGETPILDIDIVSISTLSPSGIKTVYGNATIEGNIISYVVPTLSISEVGGYQAELILYGENNKRITALDFSYSVLTSLVDDEPVINDDRYPILTDLINKVSGAGDNEDQRVANEISRINSENTRISNESTRISNESTRTSNEDTRKLNEAIRISAETARITDENTRKSAETTRINNETNRLNAESARITSETTRISNETERVNNENTRKSAEATRISNETNRDNAEATRISNETNRDNAEAKRVSNEADRVIAETNRVTLSKYSINGTEWSDTYVNGSVYMKLSFNNGETWSSALVIKGADGQGAGDMLKATYDSNENGIVDNAEKVNGHTVNEDVPSGAKFTDTIYDDTVIKNQINTHTHTKSQITDFPTLATVATSGEYNDLLNKPIIPPTTSIVNDLTTGGTTSALSAEQGKTLNNTIGNMSTSQTTSKTVVGAINELFTNANNGKTLIANVVGSPVLASQTFQQQSDSIQSVKNTLATNLTNKGQSTGNTETLQNMATKVGNIARGQGNATTGDVLSGKTFTNDSGTMSTGTMPNYGTFNLGLGASVPSGYYSGGTVPKGLPYFNFAYNKYIRMICADSNYIYTFDSNTAQGRVYNTSGTIVYAMNNWCAVGPDGFFVRDYVTNYVYKLYSLSGTLMSQYSTSALPYNGTMAGGSFIINGKTAIIGYNGYVHIGMMTTNLTITGWNNINEPTSISQYDYEIYLPCKISSNGDYNMLYCCEQNSRIITTKATASGVFNGLYSSCYLNRLLSFFITN